jgi:hypothetical protein
VKPHEKRQREREEKKNELNGAKKPSPDGLCMQLFEKSCTKNVYVQSRGGVTRI